VGSAELFDNSRYVSERTWSLTAFDNVYETSSEALGIVNKQVNPARSLIHATLAPDQTLTTKGKRASLRFLEPPHTADRSWRNITTATTSAATALKMKCKTIIECGKAPANGYFIVLKVGRVAIITQGRYAGKKVQVSTSSAVT
jgi:hypothetical protein